MAELRHFKTKLMLLFKYAISRFNCKRSTQFKIAKIPLTFEFYCEQEMLATDEFLEASVE